MHIHIIHYFKIEEDNIAISSFVWFITDTYIIVLLFFRDYNIIYYAILIYWLSTFSLN